MDFKTEGGALTIHATGVVGEKYRIEFKTDLSANGWTFLQDIEAAAPTINFTPPLATETDAVRFTGFGDCRRNRRLRGRGVSVSI